MLQTNRPLSITAILYVSDQLEVAFWIDCSGRQPLPLPSSLTCLKSQAKQRKHAHSQDGRTVARTNVESSRSTAARSAAT